MGCGKPDGCCCAGGGVFAGLVVARGIPQDVQVLHKKAHH